MARKKATPFSIFIHVFFRTMAIMLLVIAVGFTSYYITLNYYRSHEVPVDDNVKEVVLDIVSDAKVSEIAQNLICVTENDKITHAILEIFNTNTVTLDYITLPTDDEITLSNDLYQRLYAVNEEVPQVLKLSNLHKYFDDSTVYEYAEIIIGELLSTEISFYTVMPSAQFKEVFSVKDGLQDGSTSKITEYKKKFWKICQSLNDEETISEYIETKYNSGILSNLSVKNRQKYAKTYATLKKSGIHFYPSFVTTENTTKFDEEATAGMLSEILKNSDSYNEEWTEKTRLVNAAPDYDKKIYILNGASVTGLASSYQQILVNAGYSVTGIGNYDGGILTDTKILVRSDGSGYDLLSYFNNASIETSSDLPEGVDIEIILGTSDAG
jgi:hypothetical protein